MFQMDFTNLIQTFGVSVAGLVACAWFIYVKDKRIADEAKEREDKQRENNRELAIALNKAAEAIKDSNEVNKELSETNKMLVNEMKNELKLVGTNVEKILENTRK